MVAHQMEGFRERIAQRIREEAAKHGESAIELAHELQVYPTTAERWFRGDRTPQRRHRKQLAEHWDLPLGVFEPDLAAEEEKVRQQLDRIEQKVDILLGVAGVTPEEIAAATERDIDAALVPDAETAEQTSPATETRETAD